MIGEYSEGSAYLIVRKRWYQKLTLTKVMQRKPEVLDGDHVVIKIQVRIPDAAFEPLTPDAVITIPEELVQHHVEAEAVDPAE